MGHESGIAGAHQLFRRLAFTCAIDDRLATSREGSARTARAGFVVFSHSQRLPQYTKGTKKTTKHKTRFVFFFVPFVYSTGDMMRSNLGGPKLEHPNWPTHNTPALDRPGSREFITQRTRHRAGSRSDLRRSTRERERPVAQKSI